ncbi:hypothetical protein [Phenylobacterium sp.]|jgi:hypothetical protein|uniref:terminase small subunit-like protein n=1 Tax=Phenylobacterium sp. TaxID=1871053 RepID=UPI002E3569E4|nr:hypothetical protein [Phenylobacterium sp.]HEX4710092.1 hypothetical protein [Phenylobacterium sp.]
MPSRYKALPYDEALARRVLDLIAAGRMLRDLWRDPTLPTRGDLRRWRQADPEFSKRLRAAVNAARGRRMTTYDPQVAETICARLCHGESMRGICADPAMPSIATVYQWLKEQPAFARGLPIARQIQGDFLAERGWEIARAITPKTARAAAVQLSHLRWYAGKLSPKKYGLHKPTDTAARAGGETTHVYVKRFVDAPVSRARRRSAGLP